MVLIESLKLDLGSSAPDFALPGIDGKTYSLADFKDARILAIAFICNHCPYAQAVWSRLVDLQERYKNKPVQFIGINPNVDNPEYAEETLPLMKDYAERFKMNFPYLADATQAAAVDYKAQCTPDIYVYDQDRKLVYHGRVDDNWKDPEKVNKHELEDAIKALLRGEKPDSDQNPSIGCSIKWK